jgi:hypothetical protein
MSRYDQRSAQFQTIIVSATVMFAALCTVIIEGTEESSTALETEFRCIDHFTALISSLICVLHPIGNLPDHCCNEVIEYMLAIFSGLAFAFLFLSIILAIKVILLYVK